MKDAEQHGPDGSLLKLKCCPEAVEQPGLTFDVEEERLELHGSVESWVQSVRKVRVQAYDELLSIQKTPEETQRKKAARVKIKSALNVVLPAWLTDKV